MKRRRIDVKSIASTIAIAVLLSALFPAWADLERDLCPQSGERASLLEELPNKPLANDLKNDAGTRFRTDKITKTLERNAD